MDDNGSIVRFGRRNFQCSWQKSHYVFDTREPVGSTEPMFDGSHHQDSNVTLRAFDQVVGARPQGKTHSTSKEKAM
jgi:hypothetical protein